MLASHVPGEKIPWSALEPALRPRDLSVSRAAEILGLAGLLDDDRVLPLDAWIDGKLATLAPGIAACARSWVTALQKGTPRSLPRKTDTVRVYLRGVCPFLDQWSGRYDHLREVTAGDVTAAITALRGHKRHQALVALRSLTRHCKKNGTDLHRPCRPHPQRPQARDDHPAAPRLPGQHRDPGRRHPGRPARARPGRRPRPAPRGHPAPRPRRHRPRQPQDHRQRPVPPARRPHPRAHPRMARPPPPALAPDRQPLPADQQPDRDDHPPRQRELARRHVPRPRRHPRAAPRRPPARRGPHRRHPTPSTCPPCSASTTKPPSSTPPPHAISSPAPPRTSPALTANPGTRTPIRRMHPWVPADRILQYG